jgi:N-acetylglutamate synthase-like GNAT family acetyltransferase
MLSVSPRIRAAHPSDRPAAEALLRSLGLPLAGLDRCLDHGSVAESGGSGGGSDARLVGLAGFELYGDGALLRSVAVAPDWQGSGLGRSLVERALAGARAAGAGDAYLLTTTAEHWFRRFGFGVIGRDAVPPGVQASVEFREACPASATVMHRSL